MYQPEIFLAKRASLFLINFCARLQKINAKIVKLDPHNAINFGAKPPKKKRNTNLSFNQVLTLQVRHIALLQDLHQSSQDCSDFLGLHRPSWPQRVSSQPENCVNYQIAAHQLSMKYKCMIKTMTETLHFK
jgi:hypothetical protein